MNKSPERDVAARYHIATAFILASKLQLRLIQLFKVQCDVFYRRLVSKHAHSTDYCLCLVTEIAVVSPIFSSVNV